MEDDIKYIKRAVNSLYKMLEEMQGLYKRMDEIKDKIDKRAAPIVIETPAPEPKQVYYASKYPIKSITDNQMNSLQNKILKHRPESEKTNILIEFGVDQLNQLSSAQASTVIKRYWGDKPRERA